MKKEKDIQDNISRRVQSIKWWNNLSSIERTLRSPTGGTSITNQEIEKLWVLMKRNESPHSSKNTQENELRGILRGLQRF